MEDLTKQQLILLVLLITFVTSIGTGIITFTLLSEAPVEVTQTINRVVEKTIERVVPEEGKPETLVTTVVVNEDDRILESIAKNEKSIVRIQTTGADGSRVIAGLGFIVSQDGTVVSDLRAYNSSLAYYIVRYDGKEYPLGKLYQDSGNGLVFMRPTLQNGSREDTFQPAILGNSDGLKIGQSMVVISGRDSNAASIGRVFQLVRSEDKVGVTKIYSDIKISRAHFGSPALNLSGEVVGLEAPFAEGETEYSYLPVNTIKASIAKALEEMSK